MLNQAFGCRVYDCDHAYSLCYGQVSASTADLHEVELQNVEPSIQNLDFFTLGVEAALEYISLQLRGRGID